MCTRSHACKDNHRGEAQQSREGAQTKTGMQSTSRQKSVRKQLQLSQRCHKPRKTDCSLETPGSSAHTQNMVKYVNSEVCTILRHGTGTCDPSPQYVWIHGISCYGDRHVLRGWHAPFQFSMNIETFKSDYPQHARKQVSRQRHSTAFQWLELRHIIF